jgi:hypothetical protein
LSKHGSKIIFDHFNEEEGVTIVSRSSPQGVFTSLAFCAPEDRDVMNKWDGYRIADYKNSILIHKTKANNFLQRAKGIKEAIDNVSYFVNEDTKDRLMRQYHAMMRRYKDEKIIYSGMVDMYNEMCDRRLKARRDCRKIYDALTKNEVDSPQNKN